MRTGVGNIVLGEVPVTRRHGLGKGRVRVEYESSKGSNAEKVDGNHMKIK